MNLKYCRFFLHSASVVLLVTGLAKIISIFGTSDILKSLDPVFGMPFRTLFLITGALEVFVALLCFLVFHLNIQAGVVAWMGTLFLAYRISMVAMGYKKPCVCLGNLTDTLHISPHIADVAMKIILAYLLLGSYATLFWLWRQKCKEAVPSAVGATSL